MSIMGKIALVTGANGAIGWEIVCELARLGVKVAAGVRENHVASINERIAALGLDGRAFALDVADVASIDKALTEITTFYGHMPQILVNNAAITRDTLLISMDEEKDWLPVINTNLTSIYRLCRRCVRPMIKERWGRIVNISSIVGVLGGAGQANYAATKAGVIAFGKSLAQEVGSRHITVNTIAPGFIETAMTQKLSAEKREKYLANVPLGRAGTSQDIAKSVAFLVSDAAAYITGNTLHVNGGMGMF